MKLKILTIILIALLISCSNKEENKEKVTSKNSKDSTGEVIKDEVVGPKILLKYKFKKGDKFSYRLTTSSKNSESISADTTFTNVVTQVINYTFNFTVNNISEINEAELSVVVSAIQAESNLNGQKVQYDSKYIYSTRERVQYVDYEAVKKVPFRIFVNNIGQVTKVDKIEKIMYNILSIQQVPDTLSAATKEKMKANIANGTLMPLTQQMFKVISEDEVGVNSTWEMKYNTPLAVFNIENTAIFKVASFNFDKDTVANISSSLLTTISGNNTAKENNVTYTFSNPKIDGTGTVKFNNSKGLVEYSESTTNLEMGMMIEGYDNKNQKKQNSKKDNSINKNIVKLL
jgi:hypothetical protein